MARELQAASRRACGYATGVEAKVVREAVEVHAGDVDVGSGEEDEELGLGPLSAEPGMGMRGGGSEDAEMTDGDADVEMDEEEAIDRMLGVVATGAYDDEALEWDRAHGHGTRDVDTQGYAAMVMEDPDAYMRRWARSVGL